MGSLQHNLQAMLASQRGQKTVARPNGLDYVHAPFAADIMAVYRALGGVRATFPVALTPWDLVVGSVAVEFDEQLHFNRYRLQTLESSLYDRLPRFPRERYVNYCSQHEHACLRTGKVGRLWTNNGAERQFGPAGPNGDLSGDGSPRWKQRAFYDFLKDLAPLISGVVVARVAIWDVVAVGEHDVSVRYALTKNRTEAKPALSELIEKRASEPITRSNKRRW